MRVAPGRTPGPTGDTARAPAEAPRDGARQQRRGTRQRIFAAAVAEFERVGVTHSRVEHICCAAKVTRPTFYAHFPTKEDVLLELQRRAANGIADAIVSRLAEAASLPEVIDVLADGLFAAAGSVSPRLRREIVSLDVRERRTARWHETALFHSVRARFEAAGLRGEIAAQHAPGDLTRWVLVTLLAFLAGDADDLQASRADARSVLQTLVLGLAAPRGAGA